MISFKSRANLTWLNIQIVMYKIPNLNTVIDCWWTTADILIPITPCVNNTLVMSLCNHLTGLSAAWVKISKVWWQDSTAESKVHFFFHTPSQTNTRHENTHEPMHVTDPDLPWTARWWTHSRTMGEGGGGDREKKQQQNNKPNQQTDGANGWQRNQMKQSDMWIMAIEGTLGWFSTCLKRWWSFSVGVKS